MLDRGLGNVRLNYVNSVRSMGASLSNLSMSVWR